MFTWVIVKASIDSSLNLYEHCVAYDENNVWPAWPTMKTTAALRGQPCGAAYPLTLRSTCAVHRFLRS